MLDSSYNLFLPQGYEELVLMKSKSDLDFVKIERFSSKTEYNV